MPETRPRYVNPPMNAATPPFVEQGDPYAGLSEILNNLSNPQQPQPQSKLQQILQMIAQATAVGTAQDPGAALGQQIQQRQALQQRQQEIAQQAQQRADEVRLQIALERARGLSQDQQDFRKEQRQVALRREDRQFDVEREREREQRELNNDAIKRDWKKEDMESAYRLEKKLEGEFIDQDLNKLSKLEAVKNVDERRASVDKKRMSYLSVLNEKGTDSLMNYDQANLIAQKEISGEALTPEESKLLAKAVTLQAKRAEQERQLDMARRRALIGPRDRSGSGSGVGSDSSDMLDKIFDKTVMLNIAGLADERFVQMKDGSVRGTKEFGILGQMGNLPPGAQRFLSDEENFAHRLKLQNAYLQELNGRKAARQQLQNQAVPLPAQTGGTERLSAIVQDAKRQGYTDDQIPGILQKMGATTEQINALGYGGQQKKTLYDQPAGPVVDRSIKGHGTTLKDVRNFK